MNLSVKLINGEYVLAASDPTDGLCVTVAFPTAQRALDMCAESYPGTPVQVDIQPDEIKLLTADRPSSKFWSFIEDMRRQLLGVPLMEPSGGNLYHPHLLMIDSGTFWRCKHGFTGFAAGMEWVGCEECRAEDPEAAKQFEQS